MTREWLALVAVQTPGVSWDNGKHQWRARAQLKGKWTSLGYFDKKKDAINALRQGHI